MIICTKRTKQSQFRSTNHVPTITRSDCLDVSQMKSMKYSWVEAARMK